MLSAPFARDAAAMIPPLTFPEARATIANVIASVSGAAEPSLYSGAPPTYATLPTRVAPMLALRNEEPPPPPLGYPAEPNEPPPPENP